MPDSASNNSSKFEETLKGNSLKKLDLIKLLLACPSMANRASRDNLLGDIRKGELKTRVPRNAIDLIDVENIVNTLLEYSGALEELITFIRLKDYGANALEALETFYLNPKLKNDEKSRSPNTASTPTSLEEHYKSLLLPLKSGRVIFMLGAGINLCGRREGMTWEPGQQNYPPCEKDLAALMAENFKYPDNNLPQLPRVAQYATVRNNPGPVYDQLQSSLEGEGEYKPTSLHRFMAQLPKILAAKVAKPLFPVIITTNYDSLLEQAFDEEGESYDLLSYYYNFNNNQLDKYIHRPSGTQTWTEIKNLEKFGLELAKQERTLILKLHGTLGRPYPGKPSLIITEDHFINYMARTSIKQMLPSK
ncbi:MAG: SIR2 family protein, partial [Chloroflexota bacterium]